MVAGAAGVIALALSEFQDRGLTPRTKMAGGEAIAVLNLDSQPPEEAIKEVRTHPQISSVSVVKLPAAGEMPAWFG